MFKCVTCFDVDTVGQDWTRPTICRTELRCDLVMVGSRNLPLVASAMRWTGENLVFEKDYLYEDEDAQTTRPEEVSLGPVISGRFICLLRYPRHVKILVGRLEEDRLSCIARISHVRAETSVEILWTRPTSQKDLACVVGAFKRSRCNLELEAWAFIGSKRVALSLLTYPSAGRRSRSPMDRFWLDENAGCVWRSFDTIERSWVEDWHRLRDGRLLFRGDTLQIWSLNGNEWWGDRISTFAVAITPFHTDASNPLLFATHWFRPKDDSWDHDPWCSLWNEQLVCIQNLHVPLPFDKRMRTPMLEFSDGVLAVWGYGARMVIYAKCHSLRNMCCRIVANEIRRLPRDFSLLPDLREVLCPEVFDACVRSCQAISDTLPPEIYLT